MHIKKKFLVICIDATDGLAVSGLPLKDGSVFVAIGKTQGAIFNKYLMKNLQVKG